MPKAFLIRSEAQRKLFINIRADVAHRSTVSDFPLFYNYWVISYLTGRDRGSARNSCNS